MSHGNFLKAIKEFGVTGTFWKLYQQRTLKFGTLIGTDSLGNKYYENTVDYPRGQHRWVEMEGNPSFYEADPSLVPAEWHLWLHHTTDTPPTATTAGDTHRFKPAQLLHHTDAGYERNLGHISKDFVHTPNMSHHRPRGFGLGNGITGGAAASAPGDEGFYTQPGHPLDPRYGAMKTKASRPWTLQDTAEGIDAKLRLAAYRRGELTAEDVSELLEEGSAGTFAGGAGVELTPEEEQWVGDNGWDPEDDHEMLRTRVLMLRDIVNEFGAVTNGQTKFSLEAAQAELAEAQSQLAVVDSIAGKYAAAEAR